MKRLLVIAGPTAAGKTALGIALAKKLNGEIVSADSMQLYKGLDIGTAKATEEEQAQVPHHMIDRIEPGENYSVSRYVTDASEVCDALLRRGKQPIVVGGTGQYIDALLAGRKFAAAAPKDPALRSALSAEYDRIGGEEMLKKLRAVDAPRAAKLAQADKKRIIRAMEVYHLTGITITEHDEQSRLQPPAYDALYVVLNYRDRSLLYDRIEQRVEWMCTEGLFKETERLLAAGIPKDSTCMQAIGYRQAAMALRGELTYEEAVALIKQASRRYAKRQLTWFRKRENALWLEPDRMSTEDMVRTIEKRFSEGNVAG